VNFYPSNIHNSPILPVLNAKSTTFSPLVPVLNPQEIEEKNSKKSFFGFYPGPNTSFLGIKNLLSAFGPWYYLQKIFTKIFFFKN
jgi:hypothetical protein